LVQRFCWGFLPEIGFLKRTIPFIAAVQLFISSCKDIYDIYTIDGISHKAVRESYIDSSDSRSLTLTTGVLALMFLLDCWGFFFGASFLRCASDVYLRWSFKISRAGHVLEYLTKTGKRADAYIKLDIG